jgi:hypothetical protein
VALDLDSLRYVPAKYQGSRGGATPSLIVLHTGETAEGSTAAEGMASFFAAGPASLASTQIVLDNNSILRCVPDERRANGASGGVNSYGLHVEQAGRAGQRLSDWHDPYSRAVVANTVQVVAAWHRKYPHIPVHRRLTPAEMAAMVRAGHNPTGICGHVDVTAMAVILGRTNRGHWDPGPGYDWPWVLDAVAHEIGDTATPPVPPDLTKETRMLSVNDGKRHLGTLLPYIELNDAKTHLVARFCQPWPTDNPKVETGYGGQVWRLTKLAKDIAPTPDGHGVLVAFTDGGTGVASCVRPVTVH